MRHETRLPIRLKRSLVTLIFFLGFCGLLVNPSFAAAGPNRDIAAVHASPITTHFQAYAQITPIAIIKVRAIERGYLDQLKVIPGDSITTGEVLAKLVGPHMQSLLTKREQQLRSAKAQENAAKHALSIIRSKYASQLSTREKVDLAQSDLIAAHAAVQIARAHLISVKDMVSLRSPVNGTVLSVNAASGDLTLPGETVLTLLPAGKLWVRAEYYGTEASQIHVGMQGHFHVSNNSGVVPVKVIAVASNLAANGGRVVELATSRSTVKPTFWMNGQWGKVTLEGPTVKMIVVPTSALILDKGQWWVVLHTAEGDKPQSVVPGPTRGWFTWIQRGLQAGQKIVVRNAYLRYHHGIAKSYLPPD